MNSKDYLLMVATQFRDNFDRVDLSGAPSALVEFPVGCCSWAAYMIGHYLKYEKNMMPVEIQAERDAVEGDDGTDGHAWIAVGGINIDITSDMFGDSNDRVIVSEKSPWHDTWQIRNVKNDIARIETFDAIDYGTKLTPSEVYMLVKPKDA
jgi:hypothetical protein